MNAISIYGKEAIQALRKHWSNSAGGASLTGARWLYSEDGLGAFLVYVDRRRGLPDDACLQELAWEIFSLQVEIAARRAGWCPELDAAGDDLTTDC